MNRMLPILLFVFSFHAFVAQTKTTDKEAEKFAKKVIKAVETGNDDSKVLFDQGNTAFAEKDYGKADSLFTLSLKMVPNRDTYFNRAVCRRRLNDFSGYCVDLGLSANMGDKESYRLYCKECAKIDTVFTNAANEPVGRKNFEFATFTSSYNYNTNSDYEKYDRSGNMLLSYIIMGRDTIYLKSSEVAEAVYPGGNKAFEEFIKTRTGFYEYATKNKLKVKVNLALTVGSNGKIKKVKTLLGLRDGSSDSLAKALYGLEPFEPAKFNGKNVKYQTAVSIAINNNVLSVTEIKPFYKIFNVINSVVDSAEVFTLVETMPEFQGGMAELGKFLQNNLKLPQNGVSGKCFLKFVVAADGNIYNVQVLKGLPGCPECDAEAVRVVQAMPRFKPGTQNGRPVPVFFNLPINFQSR